MESLLEKMTRMNSVLSKFRDENYELVKPSFQVQIVQSIVSGYHWFFFVSFALVLVNSWFKVFQVPGRIVIGFVIALFIFAFILYVWKHFYLRTRAICSQCKSRLDQIEGDWVEFDSVSRRNVVFTCPWCRQYFFTIEEQTDSDAAGD